MTTKPEILAPVGNREMLISAVRAGADAVYLGLDSFNARRNAENFTSETLGEAVEYCHIRGVKVYLTLNIIIGDKELKGAVEKTVEAMKLGVDGVITADIGFARALKTVIPTAEIHASTQMTVHSPSAIRPLKEMGFSRVVVSREMSREELSAFTAEAMRQDMEVEVFVHGALCMSMSGQCLLSAMLGGRSGNRGLCAGPCRLPFSAEGGCGYDLSLKDLSLIPYLKELEAMGVSSFKIEGRMKRPEYVAGAVTACRQMLYKGFVDKDISEALEKVFSRSGFTDGYYKGRLGRDMFGIRTREDVLSADTAFSRLHELYRNERQSVKIGGRVSLTFGERMRLTVSDGVNTAEALGDIPERAINREITAEAVIEQLSKTGGTPYIFEGLQARVDEGLSVRMSALNALRREALEKLSELRGRVGRVEADFEALKIDKRENRAKERKIYCRIDSDAQLTEALLGSDMVILPIDIGRLPEGCDRIAVELPRGIGDEKAVENALERFKGAGVKTAFCHTLSGLEIAKRAGFGIVADFGFNTYNSLSAEYLSSRSGGIVLSPELTLNDAKNISCSKERGIISYGRLPLMLTRNCPIRNGMTCKECERKSSLVDRKKTEFPIRCRNGFSELYNSRVIWLADRLGELDGLDFEILYFTDEEPQEVDRVLSAYKNGQEPTGEYTRGLYYRGVE